MNEYDPESQPASAVWLAVEEAERLALVAAYHRRKRIHLPNAELHAVIHVVVENQLALGDEVVAGTLGRLKAEGLDRHEAIHAIGSVLAEHLYELLREGTGVKDEPYLKYRERLKGLTAAMWRAT